MIAYNSVLVVSSKLSVLKFKNCYFRVGGTCGLFEVDVLSVK